MKKYNEPMLEVITIDTHDVITASGGGGTSGWAPDSDDSEFG